MAVEPDAEQFAELAALAGGDADGPVVMLNLNRYRDRDAYARYGAVAIEVLARVGGRILWQAEAKLTVIGDESDRYDEVIAVWYPDLAAFTALATDPEILAARADRLAGLERAALICCEPYPGALSSELQR
ncbi:MAG: hypothetical protein QOH58_1269 [Thermoleophilaceae bacterium]|jgi:uncharacterized protein (DUF1330 family)|nr:hypothetical protein [Thermoleophilaceae bacterium]